MDLARLVLLHQPAAKLDTLSRLRGKQFSTLRAQRFGGDGKDLMLDSVYNGEISERSNYIIRVPALMERAIFLRDPSVYVYLAGLIEAAPDFWSALQSGIPEIQAAAIAVYVAMPEEVPKELWPKFFGNYSFGPWKSELANQSSSLYVIPWTKNLWNIVYRMFDNKSIKGSYLSGFLRHLPPRKGADGYFIGFCRSYIGDGVQTTLHPEMQSMLDWISEEEELGETTLLESGYVYPLLEMIRRGVEVDEYTLLTYPCAEVLLEYIRKNPGHNLRNTSGDMLYSDARSTWYRKNIQKVLSTPEIVRELNPDTVEEYEIDIGIDIGENNFVRIFNGIPGDVLNTNWSALANTFSSLDSTLYDPKGVIDLIPQSVIQENWYSYINAAYRLGYFRKDMLWTQTPQPTDTAAAQRAKAIFWPLYQKILAYLQNKTTEMPF